MLPNQGERRIWGNASALVLIQAANFLVPLIAVPMLVRRLGLELFGTLVFAQLVCNYCNLVLDYGFNFTATREVALASGDRSKLSRVVAINAGSRLVLLMPVSIFFAVAIWCIPHFAEHRAVFAAAYLAVIGNALYQQWYFQGMEQLKRIAIAQVLVRLVFLGLLLLLVRRPEDAMLASLLQAAPMLALGLIAVAVMSRGRQLTLLPPSLADMRAALVAGWPVFLSTFSINLYTTANTALLGFVATPQAFGAFVAADKVVSVFKQIQGPITYAYFPHIARLADANVGLSRRALNRAARLLFPPFLAIGLLLVVAAKPITMLLFGNDSNEVVLLVRMMAFLPAVLILVQIYVTLGLLASGSQRQWARLVNWTVLVNLTSLVILLPVMEPARAVAVTLMIDELWVLGMGLYYLRRPSTTGPGTRSTP